MTFLAGLGKIFGRSVKNFGRPGQFLNAWGKNSEKMYGKNPGGQKFWLQGGGEIS